jgi:hypothetical protein
LAGEAQVSIDRLVAKARNLATFVTPLRKKGSGGLRKMDNTMKIYPRGRC